MHWLSDPEAWIALLTLTGLELVLGIDNIVFISIISGRLQGAQRQRARIVGLMAAMLMRILLLLSLSWMVKLTTPLFTLVSHPVTGRDLILIIGGVFLLGKSTREIHHKLEGHEEHRKVGAAPSFASVIAQIMFLDIIFSLDSVFTAVGMVDEIQIMVTAVVVSVGFMLVFARPISQFVEQHPTVKMLALSFLLLIGMTLVADGLGHHVPKGYIYFAMGFSLFVEMLNLRMQRGKGDPVHLHHMYEGESAAK
jgi:predicted tellurium resistance membrane protein TerC